ncbi:adenylosuccinate lyase [Maribacter algicola]|uniref:Adenylosuccinate lyase n=1 Tax=Maribacter algicola TaxID=2498892 RepID=A0A3R8R1M8_9FLAO|nr:adenylosuccinate lyase [Maribacter algicola]RRQ48232.1 adenylosuccinate lyase [Maribacter algicola]
MNRQELYVSLNNVDHSRDKRTEMAKKVQMNPKLIPTLLEIIKLTKDPVSSKAAWILDAVARKQLNIILPYLDSFTEVIGKVELDSSVRPVAKVCELLMESYFSKKEIIVRQQITEAHIEKITSSCFDWLIGEHKVAAKAYSMTSLYLLGTEYGWIHPELKMVLEQNYSNGSAAYKARARMVLKKLK